MFYVAWDNGQYSVYDESEWFHAAHRALSDVIAGMAPKKFVVMSTECELEANQYACSLNVAGL